MGDTLYFQEFRNKNQFRIDYPYYGLFGSAVIKTIRNEQEVMYQCTLLNGSIVLLKKQDQGKKWIDCDVNRETPLSSIIGLAIEDFLNHSDKSL